MTCSIIQLLRRSALLLMSCALLVLSAAISGNRSFVTLATVIPAAADGVSFVSDETASIWM